MPTFKYMVDGKRVPSVTTILSRFKESGGLIHWAWDLGMQNIDYRKVRDDAADAGTLGHALVEAEIRGKEPPKQSDYEPEMWAKAQSSFGAFKEWSRQTQLLPVETEVPMTCRCHMIGGCLDAMLIQDRLALADWKTSNGVYLEYLCQLSAYGHLWTVNHPERPIEGGFHLLRFSKIAGDFHHMYWAQLDDAWLMFEHLRAAYDLEKKVKERL